MPRTLFTIEEILGILAETPESIAAITNGLTEEQLHTASSDGEWSINEVLAHLRACADMWGGAIMTIITEDHPTIRAINPRTWIKQTDYPEQEFTSSLRAFTGQRAELMALLQALPREGWSRSATVTGAGKVLERSVQKYGRWLARHERPHVKQIERIAITMRG